MSDTPQFTPFFSSQGRETEPANFLPNSKGGFSFLPRRTSDIGMLTTKEALMRFAAGSPLRLLNYLVDLHPTFGMAVWNMLRLAAPPGGARIVAVKPMGTEEGADEQDDAGTAAIDEMFRNLPKEIGGFHGLTTTLLLSGALTGLPFLEAVPGARNKGVHRLWPIDSLTLLMRREGDQDEARPYQYQKYPRLESSIGGYVPLTPERMFWRPIDALPDDPYGRAPYATALGELLRDLALMQDLTDAMHNAAYPRMAIPFNFKETFEIAKTVFNINDPVKASEWTMQQYRAVVMESSKLRPNQNMHYDASNGKAEVVEGAKGFAALEAILEYLRQRITQAVKSLPTLLGINDGSTQTYTTVEWAIYAAGLETLRFIVYDILCGAASLHLQLLGLPLIARAEYEPIRTSDAKLDAETEKQQIENEERKVDNGWQDNDAASQRVTGTDAVGEPRRHGKSQSELPEKEDSKGKPAKADDEEPPAQSKRKLRPGQYLYRVQSGKLSKVF